MMKGNCDWCGQRCHTYNKKRENREYMCREHWMEIQRQRAKNMQMKAL